MNGLKMLEETISKWPNVSIHSHRFGGTEFCVESAEIGHIHPGGVVDIPFPRPVRDALLAHGLAEEHRWVPNSGWITSTSVATKTSSLPFGSCGCRTCRAEWQSLEDALADVCTLKKRTI